MKAIKYTSTLFVLLVAVLLFSACAPTPGDVLVGIEANDTLVELEKGSNLVVSLESNPSTGYGWHVAQVDESILKQVGEAEFVEASGDEVLVGAPGMEVLRFEAVGSGSTTLVLTYDRIWEDVAPEQTFTISINVP